MAVPLERPAEELLGQRAAVHVGGVEEVDPGVERRMHHRPCAGLVDPAAKVVAAQTHLGHEQSAVAKSSMLHVPAQTGQSAYKLTTRFKAGDGPLPTRVSLAVSGTD